MHVILIDIWEATSSLIIHPNIHYTPPQWKKKSRYDWSLDFEV